MSSLRAAGLICYTLTVTSDCAAPPRIAVVGPTAVGKTSVGIEVARHLGTEIVSADSMQVYRGLDIGTAKPTSAEQDQVRFHGIDVADADRDWTLADFQKLGEAACDAISARGVPPLVVGGTGLYVRALTTDLDIPRTPPDEAFRARWRTVAETQGNESVRQKLARVDPAAAARIHVNDVGRLIRALEVFEATGVSLSEWHARNQAQAQARNVHLFGLNFADRQRLYERIDARVDQMMSDGFLSEVRGLLAAGYGRELKPMQSLGYKQLAAHLNGDATLDDAVQRIKQETRHFARRQLIWFRADARIHWLEAADRTPSELAAEICAELTTGQSYSEQRGQRRT